MAIFGGLGKALGLGSTGQVAGGISSFLGLPPVASQAISKSAQAVSDFVSIGDGNTPDVATAPSQAGVDSLATVLNVSQTSGLSPGALGGRTQPQQAFIGGLTGPFSALAGAAARTLAKPSVSGAITGAAGLTAADFIVDMFGNTKKLVITRKLQREVKKVFMMSMGDISFISANSMNLFGKSLSEDQILKILFTTFKNQGPFVTKAAVRKTRQTIRKMETLCDLKDRLAPPKRRAPVRRRSMSTSITQVK